MSKYNVGLETLLQDLSDPEFYGDLVYKFRNIADFSEQFKKIVTRYKICCTMDILRQTACMVVNPIMIDDFASFFNCTSVGRSSD